MVHSCVWITLFHPKIDDVVVVAAGWAGKFDASVYFLERFTFINAANVC